MRNLVIVGAGGCGREVLQWVKDINVIEKKWNIKGFIDDNLESLAGKICSEVVLATVDDYVIEPEDEFICCIGNSNIRKTVVEKLKKRGAKFTKVIHPSAIVTESSIISEGAIVYPYAIISDNAIIGEGCIVNMYSSVAHDSILGEYCTISAHCDVTGMCKLGDRVFMGTTSNLVPGVKIGDDVYICAGSTVMSKVRSGMKVLGNPAKIVKI